MIRELTEAFFGDESPLRDDANGHDFKYEPRPQQVQMALAVAEAIDDCESLCVEAPTGIGKTFAYLVPAYFRAKLTGRPVIISTHTISLQDQILSKDIPLLENFLDEPIKAEVAKGRSNYICLRKLNQIADMDQTLLDLDNYEQDISRILKWTDKANCSGDYAELDKPVSQLFWNSICCERGNCLNNQCVFFGSCYLQNARRRVAKAQIICANHAFFFAAMAMDDKIEAQNNPRQKERERLLPEPVAVIIDEGHTLEDAAANHLGLKADTITIKKLLNRLYSEERKTGLLSHIDFEDKRELVITARRQATLFFNALINWLEPQQKNPLRYTVPNHIENYLYTSFGKLASELDKLAEKLEDLELKTETKCLIEAIEEQNYALNTFFAMSLTNYVYWFEIFGKDKDEISFNCVPVDIAPILQQRLFMKPPVIVTSATLAVNNDIRYFQEKIGATQARALILDTPFDFKAQVQAHIARNMPDPQSLDAFLDHAEVHLKHFLTLTEGRTFVLFTSYRMMNQLAARLEEFFLQEKLVLIQQGDGLPTLKMIEKFKTTERAVIFGTASFWTGVDVPGDALSSVIIMRLPFANPDHPLERARAEKTQNAGKNAFFDYTVPEAVLKFRQGFGRLIRTKEDKGIVVILDSRILFKRYGKTFLNSIPECPVTFID